MHNLSERYIEALKQLPQYYCCYNLATDRNLTHVMSGARVFPVNEDESILEIQYLSGHKVLVYAEVFLDFAIKEAVEFFQVQKAGPSNFFLKKVTTAQQFISIREHLIVKWKLKCVD
ncbi:hypothetical protein FXQ12_24355 [Salmonella enterica]|nr:hypothetical protein [Salmonella enterica]ECC9415036.1 hypothetical protein [Salmonella enterica subsp. enterica]EHF1448576.1 hypothetical protein [Salmonella enterica subsp. enterica serovar 4,5,12:b:-]EHG1528721.1 hypothetical protein [Salmonella enterica subsp. enterica serovar 4,[5],12:b:-]ECD8848703.1 hypothetical protein [Salmonella enterica subsp. enterica]